MIAQERSSRKGRTGPSRRSRSPRFRVGDEVRTLGAGGPYDHGRILGVAQRGRYYRVDHGLGYPSTIREENLEPLDECDPTAEPARSFVPPIFRLVYALL